MMTRSILGGAVFLAGALAMPFPLCAQPAESAPEAIAPMDPDVSAGQAAYDAEKYDEALAAWRRASQRGVGAAYGGLGLLYLSGLGVPADEAAARRLFERAVAKNHLPSFLPLARMLVYGIGGAVDKERGLGLLMQAGREDGDDAANARQLLFDFQMEEAQRAAEEEDRRETEFIANDQRPGADEYRAGLEAFDVSDHKKAMASFRVAAEKGHPGAFGMIGLMLANGSIGKENGEEARRFYALGAANGDPLSMLSLAQAWKEGTGGPVDPAQAKYWFTQVQASPAPFRKLHNTANEELGYLEEVAAAARPVALPEPLLLTEWRRPKPVAPEDFAPPVLPVDAKGVVQLPYAEFLPVLSWKLEREWRARASAAYSLPNVDLYLAAALRDFLTGLEQLPVPEEDKAKAGRARIAELAQMSFTALGHVFPMTDENGRWMQWLTPNLREDLARLGKVLAAKGSLGAAGFSGGEGWASFDLAVARGALARGDHADRLRRLRMAAWKDSPEAMLALANAFREGRGVPADPALALRWLVLAVSKQHAPAYHELATWFEKGWGGLNPDKAQVNSWRYHAQQIRPPISRTRRIVKERDQWKYDAYMSGNWEFRLTFSNGTRHVSHVKMSAQGNRRFQLDYDLRAPQSHTTQAWTTDKQYSTYDSRTYPVLNFNFAGRLFTGAFTQGALNGSFAGGTWVGSRRFDLDYLDLAEQAARENRVDDALHYYTEAINVSLAGEDLYHQRRSGVYYGMGDNEAALPDVNEALRRKPRNFISLFNRALVHHELRNYQAAIADATAGLAISEGTPAQRARLLRTRARAQFAGGSAEEAVKDYAEARKLDPNAPQTRDEVLAGMSLANKAINEAFSKLGEHATKMTEEMRKLEEDRRKQNEAAAKPPPQK